MAAFPWHDSKKSALNRRFSTFRIRDKDVQSQPLICSRIFLPEKSFRITLAAFQSPTHLFLHDLQTSDDGKPTRSLEEDGGVEAAV